METMERVALECGNKSNEGAWSPCWHEIQERVRRVEFPGLRQVPAVELYQNATLLVRCCRCAQANIPISTYN